MNFYARYGKRCLDIVLTLIGLTLLSPILIVVSIMAAIKIGTPIFFTQNRPGLNGATFKMYKFRSMRNDVDENGKLLPDEVRLVPFGRFLRNSSIDELPGLWNVLRGEMSLVGPRPLLVQYLERYTPEQARRHEVRPGLSGWAQVNGRNAISWEQKFEFDVWYVDNVSLWLDIKIIVMTIMKVFKRSDISAEGHSTMPEFMGSKAE